MIAMSIVCNRGTDHCDKEFEYSILVAVTDKSAVMAAVNCVYPSLAVPGNGNSTKVLTEEQILKWKEEGYVLVDGVIPGELVNLVREVACKVYPEVKAKESLSVNGADDFGANDRTDMIFPSLGVDKAVVNEIPICKRLITAVSQLLESDEDGLLLAQCELWAKRGVAASRHDEDKTNFDQRIHIDGFNHYLTMPSDWYNPEAVAIIIYYDDCTEVIVSLTLRV